MARPTDAHIIDTINNIFKKQQTGSYYKREPIQGLEYLVSILSTYDTSDPRDTINAFRNIARETYISPTPSTFAPADIEMPPDLDYKRSLLDEYTGFIKWIYRNTGCIDILCRRWAMAERKTQPGGYPPLSALPSWIQTVNDTHRSDRALGRRRDGDCFVGLYQTACAYVLSNVTVNGYINTKELLSGDPPYMVKNFLKRVHEVIWDRCFIEVEAKGPELGAGKRIHGLAPNKARVGDILCVLFGCTVPVLLQEYTDSQGEKSYHLIGETYVYGLMDGEAILARSKEALDADTTFFRIN
ncbi:hypothetical protein B0A48_08828 [Cryoendolithus antarcticus]|uniref:Heterokaryon incompatibility domain-containing protein n=1 Tax=Cryoendolithus antarcticus TaxID=1507870 RepID=A0A1V8T4G0_9PEZI|nr:hypothetical protein B0A48_08828 [Cryoendolithus antarcticus]